MDVSNASYYIQTMKITKIKVAKWGTPTSIASKNPLVQNPLVQNPLVQNPLLQNPLLQNPLLKFHWFEIQCLNFIASKVKTSWFKIHRFFPDDSLMSALYWSPSKPIIQGF
jgi:hypothetical protein